MADSEQADDVCVPLRLRLDSAACIHEQDCEIGIRRAGRHVARVLLVAGSVGENELAFSRTEVAVSNVDGDALLALGAQTVGQQRQFKSAARRALYCV